MVKNTGKINSETPPGVRDEVIDRLYEVAMDPTRYEELLDHWEDMIRPLRKGANGTLVNVDLDAEYVSHFTRADRFLEKLDDSSPSENHLSNVDKAAAFLIGRDLRIVDVNSPAMQVLGVQKGDKLSELPIEPDDMAALENQAAAMLMSNSETAAVFRARMTDNNRLVVFQLQTLRQENEPPLVVAITSEVSWPEGFDTLLKSAFGLTTAETGVVRGLAECQSLREIADARGRSVDTVRAQLKSVLGKTETRSQTELVRLTLSMMDIASYTEDTAAQVSGKSTGTHNLETRPFHVLTLRDGRKMDYLILGDPNGRPLFFLPQNYGLVRWPASAEATAAKRGLKIVVPLRPGYGNSSPYPKKKEVGPTIADDFAQLMDHLKIDRCPVVSLGSDMFYSAYFHQAHPERISAVIACSGTFPLDRSAQYERMDKWHRFILAGARYTPHLLPFMVKAGFSLARRLGKRGFVHAVYGGSDADVATFENPEVFEAMVCGSDVCLSKTHSAHKPFALEVIAQETTNWTPVLENLQGSVPVHYLNGLQDPQVPAETLREFQEKYPWINYHTYEDAGQLVFFLKWPEIIPLIEKYL